MQNLCVSVFLQHSARQNLLTDCAGRLTGALDEGGPGPSKKAKTGRPPETKGGQAIPEKDIRYRMATVFKSSYFPPRLQIIRAGWLSSCADVSYVAML